METRNGFAAARVLLLAGLALLAGCAGSVAYEDPVGTVKNQDTDASTRIAAVEEIWRRENATGSGGRGGGDHRAARESMKRVAWQSSYPGAVRIRALTILADDPGEANQADTRTMMGLMLPTEPNMDVITLICRRAEQAGWRELTPAIVRSYARKTDPPPDPQRPERQALLSFYPGKSIEQIVYDVFAQPVTGQGLALERATKAQTAAWELLSRLDVDGSRRAALLAASPSDTTDPMLAHLRACAADLRCIPLTAAQLEWLTRLRAFDDPTVGAANRAWWDEAKAAAATLTPDRLPGWSLRNVEALRWARAHKPQWASMDADTLRKDLRERFRGRRIHARGDADRGASEMYADWAPKLAWGDLLTIAVVEHAATTPTLIAQLREQVQRDQLDTTTEYGGVIHWQTDGSGGGSGSGGSAARFVPVLYPPRPNQRQGDRQFIASDQMLAEGARSLADYHFHVQSDQNRDYAGPGPGDREYADNQGRACIVYTTIRTGVLNADYYQAGGIVIDLGEVQLKPN